ncbi:uncharacterized protein si:rp71-1d10.8 [Puntigrus tetrazona]|uniref:uncharacterized protein si:rp71-1d10.8 n=1 Tax=Puntigrus tetrazona TaxID=1606681 RepID=UPI001C890229|nr:uncharacterized protein si:rp71-1d10.8 [Puntigrus tetrazona]
MEMQSEFKGRKGLKMNQWSEERMKAAIEEYKAQADSGQRPALRLLARKWNVPKTTLQRRVKGLVEGSEHASGRKPFIPVESERELARLLTLLSERGFSLRKTDVQSLAFEFAKINGIRGFSEEKQKAGYYWFEGFMKRNPGLKIKKPEAMSPATKMNEEELEKWFAMYENTLGALGIKDVPSHIWKCDVSGLQDKCSSQLSGEKEDPCETEEETASTVLAAFNASGGFAPPLIIFKGINGRREWMGESLCVRASDNGWITAELFTEWGEMFVARLPKDDSRPHLLLLEGQSSHVFNLTLLRVLKQNRVEVVCFPAPQPANAPLFESLKRHWCEASRKWNRRCAGKQPPKARDCSVFTEAWKKSAKAEMAKEAFRTTGAFPMNKFIVDGGAHCSTDNRSKEEPSFTDFVVIQKSQRGVKTPRAKSVPYLQRNSEHLIYDGRLKQRNELNETASSYKCRGCFINHGQTGI